ncbi:aminoacyl-tRNA hydrolase [Aeromicrobium sp. YIM 150415]|uniref:Peptidyl-tRNA hydrolase n=1 Tax=Aeromicrobium piscarium TaxID=2590901 RepID=A0A554S7K8_9ACTN|nr:MULTISPECIES: aminoacyl-tRNA hydrolase [Aeromicrobium]MBM9461950.1 aminoacyl-tRNA hydrolase [Aeromicrobium sp. YIM 150415]TSD62334.1 aminoacyl-tRNA hydrolase [Aeromicrobium piscarium]
MTWLIVGLGNPGPTYAATRHNIGYFVADALAERVGGRFSAHKGRRAEVVEGRLQGERVVLGRARSYMNESGGPVASLLAYYDIEPDHLVVIHDELDIDFGMLRLKFGGGDNGHNGLKSIRQSIGTGDYYRVRVGIGRPPGRQPVHDYVLKPFSSTERKEVGVHVEEAADAIESLITRGLVATQSDFNR